MNDSTQDELVSGTATAESTPDYQIREIEARADRRLDALESAHDRARWMARLMAIGFVATLLTLAIVLITVFGGGGSLSAASLFTEEVVLRDVDGTTRGRLGTDSDGRVQFSLSDRAGRGRIRLTVLADGSPGVTISDADARPRAVLGYLPDGTTSLVLADAQGTSRAVIGLEPDGATHALFSDRAGRIRALVGVGSDGVPSVSVMEEKRGAQPADDTP
ncbi:MAG TPA: hypothetical protein VK939_05900 [Longimicrobiales bacterium]|nr:hypothetical protein [Longimicrobiales bacterium]